jgi:hypothetical protein
LLGELFDLVRQSAYGDDRFRRAIQIISQSIVMAHVMDELNVRPRIRGRDNIGSAIIGPGTTTFSPESVDTLVQSFFQLLSWHFDAHDPSQLLDRDELVILMAKWVTNDKHQKIDPGRKTDLAGNVSGHGILACSHTCPMSTRKCSEGTLLRPPNSPARRSSNRLIVGCSIAFPINCFAEVMTQRGRAHTVNFLKKRPPLLRTPHKEIRLGKGQQNVGHQPLDSNMNSILSLFQNEL